MKKKLKMIFQNDSMECGLAALAMILNYYEYSINLSELRQKTSLNCSGLSIKNLIQIANCYHLNTKVLRIEVDQIKTLKLPAILHWDFNHFIVINKINKNSCDICDPGKGFFSITLNLLSKKFTGIVIECWPNQYFKERKPQKRKLLTFIRDSIISKNLLIKILIFSFFYQVFLLLFPRLVKISIDSVLCKTSYSLILKMGLGFLGLKLLMVIAKVFKFQCIQKLDRAVNHKLAENMSERLLSLPLNYFENRSLGEILNRFNAVEQLRQIISNGLPEGVLTVILSLTTFIIMFYYNVILAFVTIFFSSVFVLVKTIMHTKIKFNTSEMLIAKSQEQGCFIENLRGVQAIKVFSKEKDRNYLWMKRYLTFLNTVWKNNVFKMYLESCKEILWGLDLILLILIAANELINKQMTIGVFYLFLFYRQQFTDSIILLTDKFDDLKLLSLYYDRLQDFFLNVEETKKITKKLLPDTFSICAINLSFKHANDEFYIFSNLNFTIHSGEMVAIIGPSGVGKTTLLKILMRLVLPTHGVIKIGNLQLDQLDLSKFMASVMQEDHLLRGTIAENITFNNKEVNWEKISHCAQLAGILDEIKNMSMKFHTMLGDLGYPLSGGQKQRILLARAFYAEPKILFLDEATSHLDLRKEKELLFTIKKLGMTCVMVTHSEEAIKASDKRVELYGSNRDPSFSINSQ